MNAFNGRFTRSSMSDSLKTLNSFLATSGMPEESVTSTVQATSIDATSSQLRRSLPEAICSADSTVCRPRRLQVPVRGVTNRDCKFQVNCYKKLWTLYLVDKFQQVFAKIPKFSKKCLNLSVLAIYSAITFTILFVRDCFLCPAGRQRVLNAPLILQPARQFHQLYRLNSRYDHLAQLASCRPTGCI